MLAEVTAEKCGCTNMCNSGIFGRKTLADYEVSTRICLSKGVSKTESGKIRKKELPQVLFSIKKENGFCCCKMTKVTLTKLEKRVVYSRL
ncbi:MAG: hypothetical protein ACLR8P_10855 [Clostridium fessum]